MFIAWKWTLFILLDDITGFLVLLIPPKHIIMAPLICKKQNYSRSAKAWSPDCWRSPADLAQVKKPRCPTVSWRQLEGADPLLLGWPAHCLDGWHIAWTVGTLPVLSRTWILHLALMELWDTRQGQYGKYSQFKTRCWWETPCDVRYDINTYWDLLYL